MKTFKLQGETRENLGKKAVKDLRKQNMIPAILYGSSPVALPYEGKVLKGDKLVDLGDNKGLIVTDFTVTKEGVHKLIYTPEIFIIDLDIKGNKQVKAILKDIQFHPVTDAILHIDFLEVFEDRPIVIDVPVTLKGHSEGVKAGGKLTLEMRKIKVKALYSQIPEKLVVNIDSLTLGKTIQVGSLEFPNLELMNAKNSVVCSVKLTRAARGAAATATTTSENED